MGCRPPGCRSGGAGEEFLRVSIMRLSSERRVRYIAVVDED